MNTQHAPASLQASRLSPLQVACTTAQSRKGGSVKYKRTQTGSTTSVEGPIKAFEGDNFKVGVGPMVTTFVVSVRPHQTAEGDWKMTVDGLELTKTQ